MECMWSEVLWEPQVVMGMSLYFTRFLVSVLLNGKWEEALVDTGCGCMLVRQVVGHPLEEQLHIFCIHGDVQEYSTVMARIQVAGRSFWCSVGEVLHLDNLVLVQAGRYYRG